MGVPSPVKDEDLRKIRCELQANGGTVRAWQIADVVTKMFNYTMDESTIRGRFIEMGEPLRGAGVANVTPTPTPTIEKKEAVSVVSTKTTTTTATKKETSIEDSLKEYIPKASQFETYVERPIDMRLAIHYDIGSGSGRHKYPITQGKQGTGKTFSHEFYAYKRKLPFFLFSCYEDFRLAKLFGDKTIENGTVRFQESLFVKAIQGPSVILFDEVNAVSNANSFDFHALLQNRELFIKDANDGKGKTYRLHPECRVGFAQNPRSAKYIGGNIKPSNFLGRCTFLTYPEFTEKEIDDAMRKKFPKVSKKDIGKFVKYYFGAVKCIDTSGLPLDISIRQLTSVIDLYAHGMKLEDALHDGLIGMLDAVSQPTAKEAFIKLAQAMWKEMLPKDMQENIEVEEAAEVAAKAALGTATTQNVVVNTYTNPVTPVNIHTGAGLAAAPISIPYPLSNSPEIFKDMNQEQLMKFIQAYKDAQKNGGV